MQIDILPGDFALVDSKKTCPRVVKYFMRSPNLWVDLWRMITKKLEKPLYYHVLIFKDRNTILEQQSKVQENSSKKLLNTNNNLLIVRRIGLSSIERKHIVKYAESELGLGYDVLNCFGDFLSWLTAIPIFKTYMQLPKVEICVNRVAHWLKETIGEDFGVKNHVTLTTHTMWKYIIAHPEKFEIIFQGIPRENLS